MSLKLKVLAICVLVGLVFCACKYVDNAITTQMANTADMFL